MRRMVSIVALATFALAACGKPAPAPEATESAAAGDIAGGPSTPASWTPALPAAGAYEVTTSEGKPAAKVSIEPDYSYSRVPAQGLTEAGIVKLTDGKVCFDPSGKDKPTHCYIESVRAADGSFTATDDKGVTVNVKPAAK